MCETHTLKTAKHCWEKLKTQIDGETYYVYRSENSLLVRCQLSSNPSTDST